MTELALAGVRVLEVAGGVAGAYCGKPFADMGASVTRIEPADGDDDLEWRLDPAVAETAGLHGRYLNAGKIAGADAGEEIPDPPILAEASERSAIRARSTPSPTRDRAGFFTRSIARTSAGGGGPASPSAGTADAIRCADSPPSSAATANRYRGGSHASMRPTMLTYWNAALSASRPPGCAAAERQKRKDEPMVEINGERLIANLRHLRTFGAHDPGVIRLSLSPVDVASRHWLVERMTEAGLDAAIDGVGNVFGRSRNAGPALLIGSHSDTQPKGGWLDGAMGVMYGIEVAQALAESDETRDLAVDVASWIDEEGNFHGFLGSRSFCGTLGTDVIETATSSKGQRLADALVEAGLDGVAAVRHEAGRYRGYLEAHIEQGPYLEETGNGIGVVTGIVGLRGFEIDFEGQQNHAGTTPMVRRKDAGVALIDLGHRIRESFFKLAGDRTVWTIGHASFDPGAQSIVPGRAEMLFQFRDPDLTRLDGLEAALRGLVDEANAAGPVAISLEAKGHHVTPTLMDTDLQKHFTEAAEALEPGNWMSMPSAAGHDAQILAEVMPCAMLFVPSIGGVSHAFEEDTADADIVAGCRVFANAAAGILRAG